MVHPFPLTLLLATLTLTLATPLTSLDLPTIQTPDGQTIGAPPNPPEHPPN